MTSLAIINTDLVVRLRAKGLPWHEVAAKCQSTMYLVRKALYEAGIVPAKGYQSPSRKPKKLLSDCHLARAKRLKAAGATWKELGRILAVDPKQLQKYVKSHG